MELAYHETIPPEIQARVRELTDAVDSERAGWGRVDPYYVEIVLRATLSAQIALMEPDLPDSRLRLRMALDSLAQAFSSIAEDQPVSDDRSGKELVAWLVATTETPQAQIAQLHRCEPAPVPALAFDLRVRVPRRERSPAGPRDRANRQPVAFLADTGRRCRMVLVAFA